MAETRNKQNLSRVTKAMLVIGIAILVLTGCEIGLGEKVDVAAPTITLTSHQAGDFLKGTAKLSGVATDDREVANVEISLDRGQTFSNVTNLKKDGDSWTWSHDLNTLTRRDGSVYITLLVSDAAGRTKRTDDLLFNIDNNAPVIVITNPTQYKNTNYNTQLSMSVSVADAYGPYDFTLRFKNSSGGLLHEIKEESKESPWMVDVHMSQLFGDGWEDIGTKELTIELSAVDQAGLTSTSYYHADDLRDANGGSLTADQLREILIANGQSSRGTSASVLLNTAFTTTKPLKITVDQDGDAPRVSMNVPSVTLSSTGIEEEYYTGNRNLLFSIIDDDGSLAAGYPKIHIWAGAKDARPAIGDPDSDTNWNTIPANTGTPTDYTYVVPESLGFMFSFVIVAKDNTENRTTTYFPPISDNSVYTPVQVRVAAGAPIVSITQPERMAFLRGSQVFTGEAFHASGMDSVELRISQGNERLQTLDATIDHEAGTWQVTVDTTGLPNGSTSFEIFGKAKSTTEASQSYDMTIDNQAPSNQIHSPDAGAGVNGIITIRGESSDGQALDAIEYRVFEAGTAEASKPAWAQFALGTVNWSFTQDVRDFYPADPQATQEITLEIRSFDRAGNVSPVTPRNWSAGESSDYPVVSLNGFTDIDGYGESFNGDPSVAGTITDDDWVDPASITIEYRTYNPNTGDPIGNWTAVTPNISGSGLLVNFNKALDVPDGFYHLRVSASDLNGPNNRKLGLDAVNYTTQDLPFVVDSSGPVLSVSRGGSALPLSVSTNDDLELVLSATDGSGVESITLTLSDQGGSVVVSPQSVFAPADPEVPEQSTGDIPHTLVLTGPSVIPDGDYTLIFEAVDIAGQVTTKSYPMKLDTTPPELIISAPVSNELVDGASYTIHGQVTDNSGMGVTSLQYSTDNSIWENIPLSGLNWSVNGVDFSAGGEGIKTLYVQASDALNSPREVSVVFNYDTSAPTLNVDGTWGVTQYYNEGFTISGNATDTNGVDAVSVNGGGSGPISVDGSEGDSSRVWSVDITPPSQGVNTVTVTAVDIAGRVTTKDVVYNFDNIVPELTVVNLTDGDAISQANYTITGTFSDPSGIQTIQYSLNDGPAWANWQTVDTVSQSWSHQVSGLTEGAAQQIRFRATDKAGNIKLLDEISFGLDLNPPTLTIDTIGAINYGDWVPGTSLASDFIVSGSSNDANGIQRIQISLNGGVSYITLVDSPAEGTSTDSTAIPFDQTISIAPDGSDDGIKTIIIRSTDTYNKTTERSFSIKFDASPPIVTLTNLVDGQLVTTENFSITGLWTDNGGSGTTSGLAGVAYSFDGITYTNLSSTASAWNGTIPFSQDLDQTLYIQGTDRVGNKSVTTITGINVDSALPETTVLHDASSNWTSTVYKTAAFNLSGEATDTLGAKSVAVSASPSGTGGIGSVILNGTEGDSPRDWSVDIEPTADGVYTYTITVTDVADRTQSFSRNITWDTTPPVLNVVNLEDGQAVISASYKIQGTAADTSGIASVGYSLNSGLWTPVDNAGQSWDHTVSGLSEGAGQTIEFRVTDNAGKTTESGLINFGLDLADPELEITTIDGGNFGDWTAGTAKLADFIIQGTSDDANDIQNLEISLDAGSTWSNVPDANTNNWAIWTHTIAVPGDPALEDGLKSVRLRVTDTYGKTTEKSFSVRFDTTAPVLNVNNLVNGQLLTASPFAITGSWTDNGGSGTTGGSAQVEYSFDGSNYTTITSAASTWSGSIPFTQGLDQTLYIRATDWVGNQSVTTITGVDVDTALPVIAETTVNTTDLVLQNAGVTLAGTASDSLGLASVIITAEKDGLDQGTLHTDSASPENWSYTLPAAGNDGLWEFTITATDTAGRQASRIRNVRMDSTAGSAAINAPTDAEVVGGTTYSFTGTASDAGGSGVEAVRISFNSDGSNPILTAGTTSWSANVNLSTTLGTEGAKTLYVQVEDRAGNFSEWSAAGRAFTYDTALPVVTLDGGATRQVNAGFQLSGAATDSYGIAAIGTWTLTQQKDGGAVVAIDAGLPTLGGTAQNRSWTLANLPRDPANIGTQLLADGVYVYTIKVEDLAVRESIASIVTVTVDSSAPETLAISAPASGQTGLNALTGSAYTFRGNASDSGVGIDKIYYLVSSDSNAPAGIAGYTQLTTSGSWSFTDDFDTDGAGADTGRAEGTWYLHVKAEDKAGNITADLNVVSVQFDIDQSSPSLTETGSGIVGSSVVYRNSNVTLSGTASDTNSLSSVVVTYSKDGAAAATLLNDETVAGGNWSTTLNMGLGDGAYEVTIRATDGVGKTTTIIRNIMIDTTAPDLTITAPVADEFIETNSYNIRGQVTDNGGKGVTSLDYSTDNSTWIPITLAGLNWSVNGVDFSGSEGNRTLYLRASDGLNLATAEVDFYYDTADPVLTETNYSTAQVITNADFTFTGEISDTNALRSADALVITASKDGAAATQVYARSAAQIATDSGTYSYTVSLPIDGSDDGTWVYTITATDVAGRTTSHTRTFLIDETVPDTPTVDAFAGAYQVNELVSSGSANDDGSGLQTVQYSFDQTNWSNASGTSSWFRTIDISLSAAIVNNRLVQNTHTLYVRAIDRAGNISASGSRSFTVDRENPVVVVDAAYDGTVYRAGQFTINGTITDSLQLAGSPIAISVDGPITDDIALGTFNYAAGAWNQVVPIADGNGTYVVTITGSDNVGRTHQVTRSVLVDTVDPVVGIGNLAGDGSTQVNGTSYTVSGTVTETGSGIASVEYSTDTTDGVDGTWQLATGTSTWSVALTGLTDTLTQTFGVRSTDNAGNTSVDSPRTFIVDLADPALAVTGGNTGESLVYRNTDITLSGTATDGNGAPGVTVTYSKDGGADVTILDGTTAQWNSGVTLQLNAGPDNILGNGDDAFLGDGEYVFTITATDAVGKTDVVTRSVRIDTVNPTAEITSLTPVINTNTVNGIITIRAAVADGIALDTLEWALVPQAGDPEAAYLGVTGSKTSPVFVINTTQTTGNVTVNGSAPYNRTLTDEATSVLYLRATDRAGNEYVISQDLAVDQASDMPVIAFTTIDDAADTPAESYLNIIESNGLVRITVTDDDLVDGGSAEISIGDNTSWQEINYNGGSVPANSRSLTLNHDLYSPAMLSEGTTLFYLRVTDSDAGSAKSGLATATTTVGPIYVMVDRSFPVITETALGGDVFRSALFSITGTISDTNALTNLTVTQSKDGGAAITVLDQDAIGTSANYTITDMPNGGVADGEYLYNFTLTDASSKQTVLERTVIIDTTDPLAPVVTTPTADAWINGATYEFEGTSSDGTGSGIDVIYVTETARGAGAPAKGDAAWLEASLQSGGTQWSRTLTVAAQGERDLHVYAVDAAGNDGVITTHAFGLDTAAPVVSLAGGTNTQYVSTNFAISGTFTDTSGLSYITVETSIDNTNFTSADPTSATFNNGAGTWSWNRTLGAQSAGTYYYRFTYMDLAGNSRQETKTVNLDLTAPIIDFTSASPSISFDGGTDSASANGTMSLSGSITENQGTANIQSMSYQLNSGTAQALPINSSFTISGIDTTSYPDGQPLNVDVTVTDRNGNDTSQRFIFNVDQSTDKPVVSITSPADSATVTTPSVTIVGQATDDDGITTAADQVQYRFSEDGTVGGYGVWQSVTLGGSSTVRSFSFNITASTDGAKLVQLQAYDEHGVISDPVTLNLTFDTNEPEFSGLSPAADGYHDGDFTLSGTATDDTGTVDTLRYKVDRNGSEVIAWTALPGTGAPSVPFSTTIDTSFGGGTYRITLEATDDTNATRTTTISVFVDKADPSVAFTAPGAASIQNNSITLTGTSNDNYGVQTLGVVVVDVNDGNTEKALPTGNLTGTTTWTVSDFDTRNATLLSYADDVGGGEYTLTLRARATDLAGRTITSDRTFTIDQSTDKPVITIDGIALNGSSTITTTTINGSVTDDDGVQSILVDTWNVSNATAIPDLSETVTLTSGSYGGTSLGWRVVLANNGNGLRAIRVRAVDVVDNNGSDYSATDYSSTDTGKIEFQLDTENPDVAFTTPSANITWSSNNTFTITGTSGDETDITDLLVKVDDNDFSSGTTVIPDTNANDWATWTYTFDQIDLNDGAHTIYVQATDSVGNTRIASRQISVDKTAPTISITSPANGSAVFGPLTIGGTTVDNAGGAGVASVAIGLGNQIDPLDLANSTWTSIAGTTSWNYSFLNINDFANTTYSVNTGDINGDGNDAGETWTDLWDFTFYVRATDNAGDGAAGNTYYLTSYTLQIDPKRDRPEISILSPEDGSTVGGYVRVFGSSFDSQYVEKVQIAIDDSPTQLAGDDGIMDTSDDVWVGNYVGKTWSEGTLDETDGDGVNWYLANGTTSWNVRLNEASEFDPTGGDTTKSILFKVRAKDYKVNPGDGIYGAEEEYRITFNKDFPKIEDISLEVGSTVGGIKTLTAIIRDETDIERIVFSNQGPLLDSTTIFQNPGDLLPPGAITTNVATTTNPYGGVDITVDLIGTGDADYQAAYPGSYRITIPINTEAAGLYSGGAGSMSVKLLAEDVTSPSPFTNQNLISFNVDNISPSSLAYTGTTEIVGTEAEIVGTVRDTGTINGIDRIVVYMINAAGELVQLKNGTTNLSSFTEADVLDEDNATYNDYRMIIDKRTELYNDGADGVGDQDGFEESLTISAGVNQWSALFDSTPLADGAVTLHYRAEDFAGNYVSDTTSAFIANNQPAITGIILGTDLNGNGNANDANEKTDPITAGYATTNFTARNDFLFVQINVTDGNNRLYYTVRHPGAAVAATTTVNGEMYEIAAAGSTDFTSLGAVSNNPGTVFTANGAGTGTGTVYPVSYTETAIGAGFASLEIDTSDWPDTVPLSNTTSLSIRVFDATTTLDLDSTDELSDIITVNIDVDNIDDIDPESRLYQLTADDVAIDGSDNPLGHIEPWNQSPFSNQDAGFDKANEVFGNDADVSGSILLRGRSTDNQRIKDISLWIDLNGDNVVDAGEEEIVALFDEVTDNILKPETNSLGTFIVDSQTITEATGHEVDWSFQWDSADVAGVARGNVRFRVTARDFGPGLGNSSAQWPSTDPADTESIAGEPTILKVDVVPYITGFTTRLSSANPANPSAFDRSASGRYSIAEGEIITITGYNLEDAADSVLINAVGLNPTGGDASSLTVNVGTTTISGPVTVVTNTIESLNNTNNNDMDWNKEANGANNNLLNDDRQVYIWDIADHIASVTLDTPRLEMNAASNWYMIYGNNSNRLYMNNNGTQNQFDQTYNRFHNAIVGYDSSGNIYGASSNIDRISDATNGATSYTFYSRQQGSASDYNTAGFNTGTFKRRLELAYNGSTGVYNYNRVEYPDMAIKGAGTNADPANIYMVYYDGNNATNPLRFRYGSIGDDGNTISGGLGNNLNNNNPGTAAGSQTMADSSSTYKGGKYAAIDATSGGVAVAVWYDASQRRLIYSYNTNPSGASAAQWQTNAKVIDSDFAGWYADIAVDGNNGIHIAYYSSGSGDLRYAYMPTYSDAHEVVTIDSYLSTGTRIKLLTRQEGSNYVPYITYFQPSFNSTTNPIRVAWRTNFAALNDGATLDKYTGDWEVMTIPTNNIPEDWQVSGGVPTSGAYADSVFISYYTDSSYERAYLKW